MNFNNCILISIITVSLTVIVAAKDKPRLIPGPPMVHQKYGKNAVLMCGLQEGTQPIQYEWYKDGSRIQTGSQLTVFATEFSSTLAQKVLKLEDSGNYTCKATNAYGHDSFTTQLIVEGPPEWLHKPSDIQVIPNQPLSLKCMGLGHPTPKVNWKIYEESGWKFLSDVQTSFHPISRDEIRAEKLLKRDQGKYGCEISNGVEPNLWTEFKVKLSGR